MQSRTIKSLHLGKEGIRSVYLLFFQALFIGVFMGSFEITTQTLFLEKYSTDDIPLAFFLSGLSGFILMAFYLFLKRKWQNRSPGIWSALVTSLLILILTVLYFRTDSPFYVFAGFVLMFPVMILIVKGFRDTIAISFRTGYVHRLENYFIAVQVFGVLLIALLIPLIMDYGFNIRNGLLISSSSILIAFIIQVYQAAAGKSVSMVSVQQIESESDNLNYSGIFRQKYSMQIVGFIVLSLFTLLFISYSFLSLAEAKYSGSTSLASFFGFYLSGFLVLSIFMGKVIFPNLIRSFGLKSVLSSTPVFLLIAIGIMDLIWSRTNSTPESQGFNIIFIFIIFAMIITRSYRETFEFPIIKILLQPLKHAEQKKFIELLQGNIREPVVMLAGLVLLGIMALGFSLLQINYLLLILIAGWIYLAFLIYNNYRSMLESSLKEIRKPAIHAGKKEKGLLEKINQDSSDNVVKWLLEFAPQAWNGFITDNLQTLLSTKDPEVKELTLDWIEKLNITESRNALMHAEQQPDERKSYRIRTLIDRYNHITPFPDLKLIETKMNSIKWEDRLFAVTALLKKPELIRHGLLKPLLKDNDFQVRISTIRMTGLFKLVEYAPELISFLETENFYPFAWNSLNKMSSEILPLLDKTLNRQNLSPKMRLRVMRLVAESESEEKVNYLVSRLNQKENRILNFMLKSLADSDFRPYEQTRIRLKELLHENTGIAAWNLATLENCQYSKVNPELIRAMEMEYNKAYQTIFLILSVLYGRKTIDEIQKNIKSGSTESIGYSIELMDLFIDDDVKEWLFIFLEAGRKANRIKKLQASFPVVQLRDEALLHGIINRDYHYIDTFTRVLAIKELEKLKNYSVGEVLIAQLFNPDDIVAETSVQQVIKHDPDILADVIPRLPEERRGHIINILERKTSRRFGDSLEIFRYLKKCLYKPENLNDFILFRLAMQFHSLQVKAGESVELVELYGESGFVLAGAAEFLVSSGNIELRSFSADELALVKAIQDSPEKNLLVKSNKNFKMIVLPLKSLRELLFDNEETFFTLLPAMFKKPKTSPQKS
jgi:hypothetical protein